MKSRKNQFLKYKKPIVWCSKIIGLLPNFLLQFIWDTIKPFSQLFFVFLRYIILKSRSANCGDNVVVGSNVTIKGIAKLSIGSNVSIHDNCYIDSGGVISIGNNVSIAHNTTLLSGTHTFNDTSLPIKYNPILINGLVINDDVWIGCGVRVLGGITVGNRVVIAAGAVVNKSLDAKAVYGGIPAKKLKSLKD